MINPYIEFGKKNSDIIDPYVLVKRWMSVQLLPSQMTKLQLSILKQELCKELDWYQYKVSDHKLMDLRLKDQMKPKRSS